MFQQIVWLSAMICPTVQHVNLDSSSKMALAWIFTVWQILSPLISNVSNVDLDILKMLKDCVILLMQVSVPWVNTSTVLPIDVFRSLTKDVKYFQTTNVCGVCKVTSYGVAFVTLLPIANNIVILLDVSHVKLVTL